MSKIGHLQNILEEIFDEYTPQFVNKMHWLQLQYKVERIDESLYLYAFLERMETRQL